MIPKKNNRASLEALNIIGGGKPSGAVKPRRKPVQHEAQIQTSLFQWVEYNASRYPELSLMYHIPNGGRRDAISGYHLKQQGVKSGVPDLCLPVARGKYHGLYIELKAEGGKLQGSQCLWLRELTGQNYKAVVCFGLDEAIQAIEGYLSLDVL